MSIVRSLGHMMLAGMFVSGGAHAFANPEPQASKAAGAGIPAARQAAILNGGVMVLAGSALALDIMPRLAALALLGTLIPTTLVGHPFWQEEEPTTRAGQQIQFLKNLSMLGGLLLVLAE